MPQFRPLLMNAAVNLWACFPLYTLTNSIWPHIATKSTKLMTSLEKKTAIFRMEHKFSFLFAMNRLYFLLSFVIFKIRSNL